MLKHALLLFLITGCSGTKIRPGMVQTETNWAQTVRQNVYEVVIRKMEDTDIKYDRHLPIEKLSYKERTDKFISIGTAFSIEENRFVSAAHVISPQATSINPIYYLRDIDGHVYKINRVLRFSTSHDLIVFDLATPSKFQTTLALGKAPQIGEDVYTVGNAQGEGISIRGGQVANFTPENESARWHFIRFSAPASPGNSGGPLLNKQGEVVGVVTMKNTNENLNFAMPIDEVLKLPDDRALFQVKNVPISLWQKTNYNNVDFALRLPQDFDDLHVEAEAQMTNTFRSFYDKFFFEHRFEIFPNAPHSVQYLRNQSYKMQPHTLETNTLGLWGIKNSEYKKIPLGRDRVLFGQAEGASSNFVIPKPSEVSLAEFLSRPGMILDQIFSTGNVTRQVADEKIKILSYDKPHQSKMFVDDLGRPWSLSVWRHGYSMKSTIMFCTAVPDGASCSLIELPTAFEVTNYVGTAMKLAHFETLSYTGTFKDWREFLALDKKLLPKVFHDSYFGFVTERSIKYGFGSIKADFNPGAEFDETSLISIKVGYGLEKPLTHEIHGISLKPRSDKVTQYIASTSFAPTEDMTTEFKKRWMDMLQQKSPFNGKIFSDKDSRLVLTTKSPVNRDVAGENTQSDRIYLGVCSGELSAPEAQVEEACARFVKGLKFLK
jgi:serine protease Do